MSFYLLQTVKKKNLLLPLLHFFKINGDIVHLQRSGTVLKLPKFYIILENWVNWKISLILSTLLVRDGTSDIVHFKHLCWSAIESWAKPILWPYQAFEFENTPFFHAVCLHKYCMHLSLKTRPVIANFNMCFSAGMWLPFLKSMHWFFFYFFFFFISRYVVGKVGDGRSVLSLL